LERETKTRLIKHILFLEEELKDYERFKNLTWEEYNRERDKRRNVERWIENIVNSSVDLAKIILALESIPLPETYREMILSLSLVYEFDKSNIEKISEWTRLRNIIFHEYLDIRWSSIKRFINETETFYKKFLEDVRKYLEKRLLIGSW
jgi:uncharacterized protein YutE (UPF0331/DUF86 family)